MSNKYNKASAASIAAYAKRMIGKSFRTICDEDSAEHCSSDNTIRNKGNLGQLIEEHYFHYSCNSDSRPDFPEAGVELKVTPYKKAGKNKISAKERLILTMIDYFQVPNETFENSHLWKKAQLILLVYYLYEKEKDRLDYQINYVELFAPSAEDLLIIKHDYEVIQQKIKDGKAHELSEGDTLYLGAATKSSDSTKRREQPFCDIPAKPRAFSFKSSYMTYVLNNYIIRKNDLVEFVTPSDTEKILEEEYIDEIAVKDAEWNFEDYIVEKMSSYRGKSKTHLCELFTVDSTKNPKNLGAMLAYRMLGVKGNKAEEFEKANIVVKTIRVEANGKIKENMSFPAFHFKELVEENWENSSFANLLRETRFLFVVYQFNKNQELIFKGCQFWNIPYEDLEQDVREVWEKTKTVLLDGLKITKEGDKTLSNLPKSTENRVCHVRPHAKNAQDVDELPDGRVFPKQCFWLNNSYIRSQLRSDLIDS